MKSLLLIFAFILPLQSFAAFPPGVLALARTHNEADEEFIERGVYIWNDGRVVAYRIVNGYGYHEEVARLTLVRVQALGKAIRALEPGELVDATPDAEYCTDQPITDYSVAHPSGNELSIAMNAGCHELVLEQAKARPIYELLRGLSSLKQVGE